MTVKLKKNFKLSNESLDSFKETNRMEGVRFPQVCEEQFGDDDDNDEESDEDEDESDYEEASDYP